MLAGLMIASIGCSGIPLKAANNDGLVAGMCAVGAAVFGIAGAVALADWCFSETDDQMIARIDAQCREILQRYEDDMLYFGQISGMNFGQNNYWDSRHWNSAVSITEFNLHEFATYIWNHNSTQQDYRLAIRTVKKNLDSSVQTLRKRVNKLGGKALGYEDQQKLRKMRQLLNNAENVLKHIAWFVDLLETHKDYFNLYDAIDVIRTRYFHEITILESRSYTTEMEIKRSILNRDNSQYAFRNFVIKIASDVSELESNIRSLKHGYNAKRQYAQILVNQLLTIKSIVVSDPRYQQELYEWEQAELQRMRIEAEKLRAQAEQSRAWAEQRKADAMREQNRIAAEANCLKQQELWNQRQCNNPDVNVNVHLVI